MTDYRIGMIVSLGQDAQGWGARPAQASAMAVVRTWGAHLDISYRPLR